MSAEPERRSVRSAISRERAVDLRFSRRAGQALRKRGEVCWSMQDDLGPFLAQIARTPLLTPAEELRLARRVERGDLAAKERMVEANLRLVVHVAKRFQRAGHGLSSSPT